MTGKKDYGTIEKKNIGHIEETEELNKGSTLSNTTISPTQLFFYFISIRILMGLFAAFFLYPESKKLASEINKNYFYDVLTESSETLILALPIFLFAERASSNSILNLIKVLRKIYQLITLIIKYCSHSYTGNYRAINEEDENRDIVYVKANSKIDTVKYFAGNFFKTGRRTLIKPISYTLGAGYIGTNIDSPPPFLPLWVLNYLSEAENREKVALLFMGILYIPEALFDDYKTFKETFTESFYSIKNIIAIKAKKEEIIDGADRITVINEEDEDDVEALNFN